MRSINWQTILAMGIVFLVVKLLLDLLVPLGLILIIVAVVMAVTDKQGVQKIDSSTK